MGAMHLGMGGWIVGTCSKVDPPLARSVACEHKGSATEHVVTCQSPMEGMVKCLMSIMDDWSAWQAVPAHSSVS
eukprot:scaffold88324_cov17-Tisochrysis_lutea.AAC.1